MPHKQSTDTVLQAVTVDTEHNEKKTLFETFKANLRSAISFVIAIILKPFQMIKSFFTAVPTEPLIEVKELKVETKVKIPEVVVVKVVKPTITAGDIAAKKYATEKLKEIDQGSVESTHEWLHLSQNITA